MEYRCVLNTTSYVQYHWRLYVAFSKDCASLWLCKMELSQIYFFLQSPQLPLLLSLLQYTWISLSLYLSLCVSLPLPFCVSLSNELEISQTISVFFQFPAAATPLQYTWVLFSPAMSSYSLFANSLNFLLLRPDPSYTKCWCNPYTEVESWEW